MSLVGTRIADEREGRGEESEVAKRKEHGEKQEIRGGG